MYVSKIFGLAYFLLCLFESCQNKPSPSSSICGICFYLSEFSMAILVTSSAHSWANSTHNWCSLQGEREIKKINFDFPFWYIPCPLQELQHLLSPAHLWRVSLLLFSLCHLDWVRRGLVDPGPEDDVSRFDLCEAFVVTPTQTFVNCHSLFRQKRYFLVFYNFHNDRSLNLFFR